MAWHPIEPDEYPKRGRSALEWLSIVILGTIALVSMLMLWVGVAKGQTPSAVQLSRTQLVLGDSDRDWLIIWTRDGFYKPGEKPAPIKLISTNPKLSANQYETDSVNLRERTELESWHWAAVRAKPDTPLGKYDVTLLGRSLGEIEVIEKPIRRTTRLTAGATAKSISEHLARGEDIILAPGEYRLTTPISLHPGSTLSGYGATLSGETGAYQKALVTLANDSTIRGVTFRPTLAAVTGQGPSNKAGNVTFADCTFYDCMFGILDSPGLQLHRCKFDRAGVPQCNGGIFVHCEWKGQAKVGHSLAMLNTRQFAMVQCRMDGTDRGPVLRGDINEPLLAGVRLSNIDEVNNGCEICCIEGGIPTQGVRRGLFMSWRSTNCVGPFQPFNTEFTNNLLADFKFDGSWIIFWGLADQSNNVIRDSELVGGGIAFNVPGQSGAKNNTLTDVAVLNWKLTRQNQMSGNPHYYTRADWPNLCAIGDYSANKTNKGVRLTVKGQSTTVHNLGE